MGARRPACRIVSTSLFVFVLAGCGGGGGGSAPPGTSYTVTLAWSPNHEKGVNSLGGGYRVSISGQPAINVLSTGSTAPTSVDTTLLTGTYTVTVTAFAALDAQGGSTGSVSAQSQSIVVRVPDTGTLP